MSVQSAVNTERANMIFKIESFLWGLHRVFRTGIPDPVYLAGGDVTPWKLRRPVDGTPEELASIEDFPDEHAYTATSTEVKIISSFADADGYFRFWVHPLGGVISSKTGKQALIPGHKIVHLVKLAEEEVAEDHSTFSAETVRIFEEDENFVLN